MRITAFLVSLAAGVWTPGARASPSHLARPRLLTGSESDLAAQATSGGDPPLWLIGIAATITLATLAWWGWWAFRYRSAAMNESERAFRRLARVIGITRSDRELLRARCHAAGVEPLAALGSPSLASIALTDGEGRTSRISRLRGKLCDTESELIGINAA